MQKIIFIMLLLITSTLSAFDLDPRIKKGKLENGVQYQIVESDFTNDLLRVAMVVKTGSMDEIGTYGVAHATEHMVFHANKYYPQGIVNYLKSMGLEIGRDFNAATGDSFTQFKFRVNPKHPFALIETLNILKAIATGANINEDDWQAEQKVIFEELRQTSSVQGAIAGKTSSILRSDTHDVGNTLGTHDNISNITAQQIKHYYQRRYTANNIEIVVVGNQDTTATIQYIKKVFNSIQSTEIENRDYQNFPLDDGFIKKIIQVEGSSIIQSDLYFRLKRATSIDDPELAILDEILISMVQMLSALDKNNQQPVYINLSTPTPQRAALHFSARADDTDKSEEKEIANDLATQKILRTISRLERYELSEELLKQAKERYLENLTFNQLTIENRQPINWIEAIINSIAKQSKIVDLNDPNIIASVQKIKLKQVQKRLHYYLNSTEKVLIYQAPKNKEIMLPTDKLLENWAEKFKKIDLDLNEQVIEKIKLQQEILNQANTPLKSLQENLKLIPHQPVSRKMNGNLHEWHYENGNKLVYLDIATSDDKLLASFVGSSGALNSTLPYWLALETFEISKYAPPIGFNLESWMKWKKNNGIVMWNALNTYSTEVKIQVKPSQLEHALVAYYTQTSSDSFSQKNVEKIKESHLQAVENASDINSWRFGGENPYLAGDISAASLSLKDLRYTFKKLLHQPKTLFIIGKTNIQQLQKVSNLYLGGEVTTPALDHYDPKVYRGVAKKRREITKEAEPVTHVAILSQTNYQWKPELAYFIYGIQVVGSRAISNKLREDLGKVYSPHFSIQTTPETNKVDIYLFFDAKPEEAEALAKLALNILDNLESEFTDKDVSKFKHDIAQVTENLNVMSDNMKLKRLEQSYFARGDASYLLKDTPLLSSRISLSLLKKTYRDIWQKNNTFISYSTEQ